MRMAVAITATIFAVGNILFGPAVNARVGDVVGNLLKRHVLQHDVGHGGIRQCDVMPTFTVYTSQNRGCAISCAAVFGGITWETWSRGKGDDACIRMSFRITVFATSMDRCFGSPEIVGEVGF